MNKLFIFLIMTVIVSMNCLALTIEYPNTDYIQQNTDYNFQFYTYDSNNNLISSDCNFTLYKINGTELMNTVTQNGLVFISGSNFSNIGNYYFHIYCNTTTDAGFVNKQLEVTQTGKVNNNLIAYFLGCGLLILLLVALMFVFEYEPIKIGLLMLITGMTIPIASEIINIANTGTDVFKYITIFYYLSIGAVLLYLLVYLIDLIRKNLP